MIPSLPLRAYSFLSAFFIILLAGTFANPAALHAQMFSVSEASERERSPIIPSPTFAGGGLMAAEFSFYGSTGSGSADFPGGFYEFDDLMYTAGFYSPGLFFEISDGTSMGEENDIRATHLALGVTTASNLLLRDRFNIRVPVGLTTSYFLVRTSETAGSNEEFSQSSVYLRSGIHLLLRPVFGLVLESISTPSIGYTIGAFGDTGGLSYILDQQFRVGFPNIGGSSYGISLGAGAVFTRFDNSEERFRYDLSGFRFTAGLSF